MNKRHSIIPNSRAQDSTHERFHPTTRLGSHNKLIVAGGVTAGVGLIMLGVMAAGLVRGKNADADGNALVDGNPTLDPDDPALQDIDKRGKSGNAMAIAGGVVGFIGVGVGVTLLVLGVRGKPSRVAAAPYATPQSGGLVMRWQF